MLVAIFGQECSARNLKDLPPTQRCVDSVQKVQLEALQFSSFIQNVISSCGRVGGSHCKVCVSITTPTATERQTLCTRPGEFPSYGLCSLHYHHATLEFRTMISSVLSTRFTKLLAVSEDVGSHSESSGNNAADNTKVVWILSDMILVVGACHAILFWPPHFARLAAFFHMRGSCCCWFARLPNTREAKLAYRERLSSHYSCVRAFIFADFV